MTRSTFLRIVVGITAVASFAWAQPVKAADPVVVMKTNLGTIEITLDPKSAPITTANFLAYVDKKFYDGTVFHRVVRGFVAQGGGFTPDGQQKPTAAPIKNEASNGLHNVRGTISMARTSDPDSATSQFFLNFVDNSTGKLDPAASAPRATPFLARSPRVSTCSIRWKPWRVRAMARPRRKSSSSARSGNRDFLDSLWPAPDG